MTAGSAAGLKSCSQNLRGKADVIRAHEHKQLPAYCLSAGRRGSAGSLLCNMCAMTHGANFVPLAFNDFCVEPNSLGGSQRYCAVGWQRAMIHDTSFNSKKRHSALAWENLCQRVAHPSGRGWVFLSSLLFKGNMQQGRHLFWGPLPKV